MYIPNFNFLAQFGVVLCEEQTQKMRKNDQKTTGLQLNEIGTKFQLLISIWLGDGEGTAPFQGQIGVNPHISPPN